MFRLDRDVQFIQVKLKILYIEFSLLFDLCKNSVYAGFSLDRFDCVFIAKACCMYL